LIFVRFKDDQSFSIFFFGIHEISTIICMLANYFRVKEMFGLSRWFGSGKPRERDERPGTPRRSRPDISEIKEAGWNGESFQVREPNQAELWGEKKDWDKGQDGNLTVRALILRLTHHFENIVSADVNRQKNKSIDIIRHEMLTDSCNPPIEKLTQDFVQAVQLSVSKEKIAFDVESKQLKNRISFIDSVDFDKQLQLDWVKKFQVQEEQKWSDFFVQTLVEAYFAFVDMFVTEILKGIRASLLEEDVKMADARSTCLQKLQNVAVRVWNDMKYKYDPQYIRVFESCKESLFGELERAQNVSKKFQSMVLRLNETGPPEEITSQDDLDVWHIYIQKQMSPTNLKEFVLSADEALSKDQIERIVQERNGKLQNQLSKIL
jgi:hypothetical protein